jgi:hypothetical protein
MNSENLSAGSAPIPPKPNKPIKKPPSAEAPVVHREKPVKVVYQPPLPMLELSGNMPIPSASEPLQYRAIGLVRGRYLPAAEEFTRGSVLADDGTLIDAVLLGRIMSLAKKHLDLEQSHLWVVYPRIRKDDGKLHAQVMGIWDPKLLVSPESGEALAEVGPMEIPDNYFSVRGEVVFQARDKKEIFVKIRQTARKKNEEDRHFKLRLIGDFPQKMVGNFWEFDVLRQGDDLVIRTGNQVASLRAKPSKGASGPRKSFGKTPMAPREDGFVKPVVKPKKTEE